MEWKRELFRVVDDPAEINIDIVTHLLADTYWGQRRSRAIIEKLIQNSLCFSLFSGDEQIGFARVVTDYSVFSWLSDLVIVEAYRNKGVGEWFIEASFNIPNADCTADSKCIHIVRKVWI
jgi:predicted acetyltransferase